MEELKERFPLGTKVVPHSKNAYTQGLGSSMMWRKAQKIDQAYLFINGYEEDKLILGDVYDVKYGGDYYLPSDITLYTEEPDYQIY